MHFALIAVSAGLILLVLSATRYDINAALAQMGQLLALQPQWSIPWLIGLAEKRSDRSQQGIKDFDIWKKDFFEIHIVGQNGNPIQDLQLGVHPSQQNWLIPEEPRTVPCPAWRAFKVRIGNVPSVPELPNIFKMLRTSRLSSNFPV